MNLIAILPHSPSATSNQYSIPHKYSIWCSIFSKYPNPIHLVVWKCNLNQFELVAFNQIDRIPKIIAGICPNTIKKTNRKFDMYCVSCIVAGWLRYLPSTTFFSAFTFVHFCGIQISIHHMYYLVYYTHYRLNVAATIAVAVFAIPFTVLFVTFLLLLVYPPRFYQQKSQFLVRVLVFNTSFYCQCLLFGLLFLQCLFLADTKCHTERFVPYFFFPFHIHTFLWISIQTENSAFFGTVF